MRKRYTSSGFDPRPDHVVLAEQANWLAESHLAGLLAAPLTESIKGLRAGIRDALRYLQTETKSANRLAAALGLSALEPVPDEATNAIYTGRATPRTLRLLPDGRVFSARSISKVRASERGWRYSVELLVEAGAPPPADLSAEGLRAWLGHAVAAVTRPLRHGGNHRYLWALNKAASRTLPKHLEAQRLKVQPYPKFTA